MKDRQGLDFLYGLQLFGIKLGLDKVRALLTRFGNPHTQLRFLHIAGTNGKGSTATILATLLTAGGARAGLYTSPHLHRFNERIKVDGAPIPDADLARLIARIRPVCIELQATFFEAATTLALLWFAEQQVDWVVLETGLGGRLDATNVVSPRLSLITPIAMDHADRLGDSLGQIAREKAGILKPGVPALIAPQPAEAMEAVRRRADDLGIELLEAGREWTCVADGAGFRFAGFDRIHRQRCFGLLGEHQAVNAGLALAALAMLCRRGEASWPVGIEECLETVSWPGRLEWLGGPSPILLDGAHNLAGAQVLRRYLEQSGITGIQLLFGAKQDKQWEQMLECLHPLVRRLVAVDLPIEGGVAPGEISAWCGRHRLDASVPGSLEGALQTLRGSDQNVPGVVAGSLFLVAAAREKLLGSGFSGQSLPRPVRAM